MFWILLVASGVEASWAQKLESVDSMASINALRDDNVYPVDLEATITYLDEDWGLIFIIDRGIPGFVYPSIPLIPEATMGSKVQILGTASSKEPGVIRKAQCAVIGHDHSLKAWELGMSELSQEMHASHLVEVEGTVEELMIGHGWCYLILRDEERLLDVYVRSMIGSDIQEELLHARVRLAGTLGVLTTPTETKDILYTQNLSTVKIVTAAPPQQPRIEVMKQTPVAGQYVALRGYVTHKSGEDYFFMENEFHAVRVTSSTSRMCMSGEVIEVCGHWVSSATGAEIQAEQVCSLRYAELSEPALLKATEFDIEEHGNRRQRVEGKILKITTQGDTHVVTLESSGVEVLADFVATHKDLASLEFNRATELSVTGVCTMVTLDAGKRVINVHAGSLDNVSVLHRREGISAIHVWAVIACLLLAALLFHLYTQALRRHVTAKTRELHGVTARLRASYEACHEAIAVVGNDGIVRECNGKFESFFGRPLKIGDSLTKLQDYLRSFVAHPMDPQMDKSWTDLEAFTGEHFFGIKMATATERIFEVHSAPVFDSQGAARGRLWSFHELTEQKQLESSLVQAQKMEAVGRLAGGIAHDFNNLLTGISGNISVARLDASKAIGEVETNLDAAESAAQRAAELIKGLLGYSRKSTLERQPGDVNRVVAKLMELLRYSLDATIAFESELAEGLWASDIDGTHIEQVLMNLCVNARDALPEIGGRIKIRSNNVQRDIGDFVRVTVEDNGKGIPESVRAKIFEPFFTTKEQGKGTGLGLAMSFGIVKQHEGFMECESEEGQGTRFHIYLPRAAGEIVDREVPTRLELPTNVCVGRHVLLADDEAAVRMVGEGLLRHCGFKVTSACNGREAVEIVTSRSDIDLVILDLTMPVMSGKEALKRIRAAKPDMPIIVCSGYLVDLNAFTAEAGTRPNAYIPKPFDLGAIVSAVNGCLPKGSSAAA